MTPMFVCHLYVCMLHTFVCPQGCTHPHMPPYSSVPLCFWRLCMLWGVVMGSSLCWDTLPYITPVWGCLPFNYTPHTQSLVPSALVCFRDISMLCEHLPSGEGFGGVFPINWGLGTSAIEMSYAHSCTFFVVHYASHFDYGSNYYSSSYSGIFWLVFHVICDSGSFPDRVSSKLGSAWHGSTTTLDAERLWRCSWLSFCATAANSIFNASFSLCQLCYGFSTCRFLFQSWASHHLYLIYMFGVCSGVCFLLLGAKLDAIFTYGGSTFGVCTLATLWSLPMAGICATWWWPSVHTWYALSGCSLCYLGEGGAFCYSFCCAPTNWWGIQPWGSIDIHPIPLPSLCDEEGSSFASLVPSDDAVNSDSVMGIKLGDSGVVIGYQVDEFTRTCSAEQFMAHSHIYPGFTGKVSALTHFPLEPGCEDYAFLD